MSALDPFTVPRIVERIGGRRRVHHAPTPTEDAIVAGLGALLSGPYRFAEGGPGGWMILERPRLALGDDRLQPDLAGWRSERIPRLPDTTPLPLAPDFVCEVEGPGDARIDRVVKRDAYGGTGWRRCGCWIWSTGCSRRTSTGPTAGRRRWWISRTRGRWRWCRSTR